MADVIEQIRNELSGENKFSQEGEASAVFALAVNGFTDWPVDAWAGKRDGQGRLRTLYWIKGNTIGMLTAEGDSNSLAVTGWLIPISNIKAMRFAAKVSTDHYNLGHGEREITIEIEGYGDISLNVADVTGHLRIRANDFINALLDAVGRS